MIFWINVNMPESDVPSYIFMLKLQIETFEILVWNKDQKELDRTTFGIISLVMSYFKEVPVK